MGLVFGQRIRAAGSILLWTCCWLAASLCLGQNLTVLSSASYAETIAPGSAATAFGSGLSTESAIGPAGRASNLPRELAGVAVAVNGFPAQIAYVSPEQINFVVPRATTEGAASIAVSVRGQVRATGSARVARLAPGIFSADGSGRGPGLLINTTTRARAPFLSQTAELPGCDKRTRLSLFASGIRYAGNPNRLPLATDRKAIEVVLEDPAGVRYQAPVEFAGGAEAYPGIDEVRFIVPENASRFDQLRVRVLAEKTSSNEVTVALTPAVVPASDCSTYGVSFVYNTVADLLAGDLWDTTSPAEVFADLSSLPRGSELGGVGTTALEARNGEMIGFGFTGSPELIWADPEFPPSVRTFTTGPIPFLALAAGNPASAVTARALAGALIHQQIVDLARQRGIAYASVRVSGRFSPVSYSVAHNLLKQGTPLADPAADKAPFQLFFTTEGSAAWEFSGFYAAGASLQEVVSVPGAPLHLHGFQLDRSRAGHIGSAVVESAEIRLYPLAAPVIREADLTIRNVIVRNGRVSFEALNAGHGTVSRTSVQGLAMGRVIFQTELSGLRGGQPRAIAVDLPAGAGAAGLQIVVDPFNDVLESDEWNNLHFVP